MADGDTRKENGSDIYVHETVKVLEKVIGEEQIIIKPHFSKPAGNAGYDGFQET